MRLRMDPITIIVIGIVLAFGFNKIVDKPVCYLATPHEQGKTIIKPIYCEDLANEGIHEHKK